MAINGILGELGNGVDGSLFADDLANIHYKKKSNLRVAYRALQEMTNNLDACAAENDLTFFTQKTVSMIFRKRRKRNEEPIVIMLRNKIIPFKESIQFLGMTLD